MNKYGSLQVDLPTTISQPIRLLVVEDNIADVSSIKRLFKGKNIPVTITHCLRGEEALEMLRTPIEFDAIVTDFRLPGISGIEFSKQLDIERIFCPVVMLTGQGNEMAAVEAMKAGVSDYIVKGNGFDSFQLLPETVLRAIEKKQERDRIRAYENQLLKLSQAVEQSGSAILIASRDGVIEYVNPKFSEVTGYPAVEVVGKFPNILKSGNTPPEVYQELWDTITRGDTWKGEFQNRTRGGELYWAKVSIAPVKDQDERITHFIEIQEDITETRCLTEQLSYQASHDGMTGLFNRAEFERRLAALLERTTERGGEHTLCYLDLDQFKVINDTCGHVAGDEMLRQIAGMLRKLVRRSDMVCRLGGDEFAIVMENCPVAVAERIVNEQYRNIRNFRFSWENKIFAVGASIGLVAITAGATNVSELLRQADAACYAAKDRGRNCVHVYSPDDEDLMRRHGEMQWVTRIHQALDQNLFELYFQPIRGLGQEAAPGKLHYEILLRMIDGNKLALPGAFLPAAERFHLSNRIDCWVVRYLFELFERHPGHVDDIGLCAINISGQSLANQELLECIVEQLNRPHRRVAAHSLCFEITETAAISNLSNALQFIETLRKYGCRFALDDFGSGFSSFGYLKKLPVHYLKIDGAFVQGMAQDATDFALVKSINEIGHVLGKATIAEFVEDEATVEKLKAIGVDYIQGYYLGKPASLLDFLGRGQAA